MCSVIYAFTHAILCYSCCAASVACGCRRCVTSGMGRTWRQGFIRPERDSWYEMFISIGVWYGLIKRDARASQIVSSQSALPSRVHLMPRQLTVFLYYSGGSVCTRVTRSHNGSGTYVLVLLKALDISLCTCTCTLCTYNIRNVCKLLCGICKPCYTIHYRP